MKDLKLKIKNSIISFNNGELFENSISLFETLGYNTARQNRLDNNTFKYFKDNFVDTDDNFNEEKALVADWVKIELLFQLTNEEVTDLTDMFSSGKVDNTIIESYLFFAVELKGTNYSRTKLSAITREINKLFSMPVMILFFYDEKLTLSVISRRLHKRDSSKDVLEKVTLIKDIRTANPHRAHIEILYDLSFPILADAFKVTNFVELHRAWEKILDTKELNKKFFKELSNWYFWAVNEVEFPDDAEKDRDKRNPISVIRLITRLMFVWFIKEKGLVPEEIFDKKHLDTLLNYNDVTGSAYYKAILQNLFFATLNTEMNKDKPNSRKFVNGQYLVHNLYRYENLFKDKTEALKLFENIPFLNGGLFECLDRKNENDNVIRIDCFSENPKNQKRLKAPDYLFFGDEQIIDLSDAYGNKKKSKEKVRPIIDILNSYKFTIAENTPIVEEVALDPELLGKVFENLLASYNPETKTTARKQTGSFYTPREIVNYMVDESLIAYFITKLMPGSDNTNEKEKEKIETKLRQLFEYNEQPHQFDNNAVDTLINAIDEIKILDPAAGSGAFPMGILHRLVFLLHKLDPHNKKWKQKQIDKISEIEDPTVREQLLTDVEESFTNNELDYGRKLYLIENCIYGVDIQPVAVQIAKLRFFISLVVDQKVNPENKNLGIRPLPNLETKFVAANTLIGLEKEEDNLFTNPNIDEIKKQLKNVRHRYFTARTHKTKEKYRKKDKELRQKLSDLLTKEHYLQPEDAKMLAKWDPYDQNASSPFFDPEWMFGITNGFNIVIGNPPYVFTRDVDFKCDFKKYIENHYFSKIKRGKRSKANQSGKINLFAIFIIKGLILSKTLGNVIYILPNNILRTTTYDIIRKYILDNAHINQIVDLGSGVFNNVTASTIILHLNNKSTINKTNVITNINDISKNDFTIKIFDQFQFKNNTSNSFNIFMDENALRISNLINKSFLKLNSFCKANIEGIVAHKHLIKSKPSKNTVPLIEGKDIKRFHISKPSNYLLWDKQKIHRARPDYLWDAEKKIIIQRISGGFRPLVSSVDVYKYKTFASTNNIVLKQGYEDYYYFISAIINSYIVNWYYANNFSNNSSLTVNISKTYMDEIPIPMFSSPVSDISIFIHFSIYDSKEYHLLETIINAIIFELYFEEHMKEREIDILKYVEEDLNQVMQGREFEQLTDTEKEEVIEKLHKKWTHPDSIVRNRIKLMPIKSPDIIKPILES